MRECSACGHGVGAENRFCSHCGARLPAGGQAGLRSPDLTGLMPPALAAKINAAAGEIVGERRDVTVLFVDATDFSTAARRLDSEDVYHLIDEALRLLVAVVYKYEGTIDKFTGDGLMALFGAPVSHENDPERAVRAALEMQTALWPLQQRAQQSHGFDFQMRIGVHTGRVVAGGVGGDLHMEYTVVGDTVNLAQRLETAAEPGTVLVSFTTYRRTGPLFEFEPQPPFKVKGFSHPIQAFRPSGLRAKPGRVRGLPGLYAPMIGRQDALARLQEALADVCQRGQPKTVFISGEAGVGKSRLVAEFRHALDQPNVCVYQGACLNYAHTAPLGVVSDLLRDILNVSEQDPADQQLDALRTYLEQMELANDQVLPFLANLLGLAGQDPLATSRLELLDPSTLLRQTHAALRRVFVAEARLSPTLLIFEDLHWIDPASVMFLEQLLRTTDDVPLLLLLVSRTPDANDSLAPVIDAARQDTDAWLELGLGALSELEGRLLVGQLLRQWTDEAQELKRQVATRAEGNPFYTEELVRMLIDQEALVGEPGCWQIGPDAYALLREVPGTLKGLILARFDRLSPGLRRTLQKAAVVGRSFPVKLLQAVNGEGPEAVAAHLAELERRQFLIAEHFDAGAGYAFCHALTQESVYGTLLKRDRRLLHGQVAGAIQEGGFLSSDERTERLAHHYANSTTPTWAIPYLVDAATSATRRGAYRITIQHARKALQLMADLPQPDHERRFQARLRLGRALKFVGQFAEAGDLLWSALQDLLSWSTTADSATLLSLAVEGFRDLADIRMREGAFDEAIAHLEAGFQALGLAGAHEHPRLWRRLMDRLAFANFRQGKLGQAYAQADAAAAGLVPEQTDDPPTLASLYNTLGGVYWQRGNLSWAISYVERSYQLYKTLGDTWGMANAYTNLGTLYYARGEWGRAAEYLTRADIVRRDNGYMPVRALGLKNLGVLRMAMGAHGEARQDLETSLAISRQLGDEFGVVLAEIGLAALSVREAQVEEAATHVAAARQHLDAAGEDQAIQVAWLTALVQADQGDPLQGLCHAEKALKMARQARLWEEEADCLRVLGNVRAQTGAYAAAEAYLRESIDLSQRQEDRYRQAQAMLELGRLFQERAIAANGSGQTWRDQARAVLQDAAAKFGSLGATYDLELARAALG